MVCCSRPAVSEAMVDIIQSTMVLHNWLIDLDDTQLIIGGDLLVDVRIERGNERAIIDGMEAKNARDVMKNYLWQYKDIL